MKKILYYFIFSLLQYNFLSYGWEVHVIPVYKDSMTGQWNGLFGHNAISAWSDFKKTCFNSQKSSLCAAQALYKQTNNAYMLDPEQLENLTSRVSLQNGDMIYCIPVKYVSAPHLHKMMEDTQQRDLSKDKFVWLPIEEIINHRTVVKLARDKKMLYVFDANVRTFLKNHWYTKLLPELNAAKPNPMLTLKNPVMVLKNYLKEHNLQKKQRNASLRIPRGKNVQQAMNISVRNQKKL